MNREILFHGKRLDNGEWVEGSLCIIPPPPVCFKGEEEKPKYYIYCEQPGRFSDWGMPCHMVMIEVDPATVGRYTGLNDKNGVKIFEGDIVKSTALANDHGQRGAITISEVGYSLGCYVYLYQKSEHGCPIFPFCVSHDTVVIGNIHDNPDLLK